jgi:hypothetical protein
MSKQRRRHSAEFKFQVALEAAKISKTISELTSEHAAHPVAVRISSNNGLLICYEDSWEDVDPQKHSMEHRLYSEVSDMIATELITDLSDEYNSKIGKITKKKDTGL